MSQPVRRQRAARRAPPNRSPARRPSPQKVSAAGRSSSHATILARVRKLCLGYPDVSERPSHGSPTFFVRGSGPFVMFMDNHHGDGRLALWCAAPRGVQEMLVSSSSRHYFVPPYVGYLGWVGVQLDRGLAWRKIADVVEDAYLTRAPSVPRPPRTGSPRRR